MAIKLRKLGGLSDFDGEGDLDVLAVFESVVGDDAVLLHSAMQVGEHGRYSIIGFDILDKYVVDGAGNQDEANEALMGLKKKWDS
ncbi:hypothetical protein KKG71_05295, partial [Patescibacteria group bacterium]|nr:hypothetical protein [Patescibacteria group bacterium]